MPAEARRFVVRGRVQGVGYRVFARQAAARLGLAGWVRNLPDGRSVEAEASGDAAALDAFASALREGPPGGHVGEFEQTAIPADSVPGTGFRIR